MIISASRRTDIPAFYGDWFKDRIRQGFFYSVNPFNAKQVKGYSLLPEDVDTIAFWTKNPKPFLKYLAELDKRGYNYYFQFTLNNYPKILEPNMPPLEERIDTFLSLSDRLGKRRVIWRYDPIILSSETGVDYHLNQIGSLAERLQSATFRLTISFLDFYAKVENRLRKLEDREGVRFQDITKDKDLLMRLCTGIRDIVQSCGLELTTCAEALNLNSIGIKPGACIDASLIREVFGIKQRYPKDTKQRTECLCAQSVDMGMYNTCGFQCTYCYANYSTKAVRRNMSSHHPDSPVLVGQYEAEVEIQKRENLPGNTYQQQTLFD